MKFISWNVNGLRAAMKKGFADFFNEQDADFFALQETKMQPDQLEDAMKFDGYHIYMNIEWEEMLRKHLMELDKKKPVIYTGDLNVAHEEIDLKNPATNHKNPGFSDEERAAMTKLLGSGFCDTFRELYPDTQKFSWWSYRMKARERNVGWRIDYFLVSQRLLANVQDALIFDQTEGSDHCPVGLNINL